MVMAVRQRAGWNGPAGLEVIRSLSASLIVTEAPFNYNPSIVWFLFTFSPHFPSWLPSQVPPAYFSSPGLSSYCQTFTFFFFDARLSTVWGQRSFSSLIRKEKQEKSKLGRPPDRERKGSNRKKSILAHRSSSISRREKLRSSPILGEESGRRRSGLQKTNTPTKEKAEQWRDTVIAGSEPGPKASTDPRQGGEGGI